MKRPIVRAAFILILALFTAVAVVALGSGHPFLPPHVVGFGDHLYCIPLTYRVTDLDRSYGLTREQAVATAQAAADIWNDAAGCEMLTHAPDGRLEIRFLNPIIAPRKNVAGRYYDDSVRIDVFSIEPTILTELVAHEMGHALWLDHVQSGTMQAVGFGCSLAHPCPTDDDFAELRSEYLFLWDVGRPNPPPTRQ